MLFSYALIICELINFAIILSTNYFIMLFLNVKNWSFFKIVYYFSLIYWSICIVRDFQIAYFFRESSLSVISAVIALFKKNLFWSHKLGKWINLTNSYVMNVWKKRDMIFLIIKVVIIARIPISAIKMALYEINFYLFKKFFFPLLFFIIIE